MNNLKASLVCLVLLCSAIASYGQTQSPSRTYEKQNQEAGTPQNYSAAQQQGTEQSPFVIKILPAEKNEMPASNDTTEDQHQIRDWMVEHLPELLLALFTLGLWCVTYQLVRDAKDTARRQLRAYVYLDTHIREYPSGISNRYAVSLMVTNSGKTWARNLTIQKQVIDETVAGERDPFELMTDPPSPPMVLGPGQTHPLQFGEVQFSDLSNITKGTIRRSYVAVARYRDTLSPCKNRQTHLSRHLNGDTEPPGPGHISFSWNTTHNCADDDCP